jgi:beta-glucosidase
VRTHQEAAAVALAVCLGCSDPGTFRPQDYQRSDLGRALSSGFLLGTATAAHQIEGGNTNNDWWDWEHGSFDDGRPHIHDGDTSETAALSWGRFSTVDLPAMKQLGVNAYRFSVEWSRLEPSPGAWDVDAAEAYRAFAADLRQNGIEPMVTLHHFTSPRWIAQKGGFANRETLEDFAAFTARVADLLGSVVDLWCTLNEPNVYTFFGYIDGTWPPGKQDTALAAKVLANMLEAHALASQQLRGHDTVDADGDGQPVLAGLAHHVRLFQPASASTLDATITGLTDDFFNEATVRALSTGRIKVSVPGTVEIDREVEGLREASDFLGVNYYTRDHVRADLSTQALSTLYVPDSRPKNDLGWDIYPEGLLMFLERFAPLGLPLYVTENGVADEAGNIRPDFLRAHVYALQRAILQKIDVRGYFHWSLMDNFEWADGYMGRFGLFRVDRSQPDLPREPTDAVYTFRHIACNLASKPASAQCP